MANFDFILFDADNTLFDFDRAETPPCGRCWPSGAIPMTAPPGTCTCPSTETCGPGWTGERSSSPGWWWSGLPPSPGPWAGDDDPVEFNRDYLDHLAQGAFLLPGAEELCRHLAPHCTLAIITNGVARAQKGRFARSPAGRCDPLSLYFGGDRGLQALSRLFEPVLHRLGDPSRDRVLVVGDNLSTDIRGGLDCGLPTAWYNPRHLPNTTPWTPRWEAADFSRLEELILDPAAIL